MRAHARADARNLPPTESALLGRGHILLDTDFGAIDVWHRHCLPAYDKRREESLAMAKILGALLTAIVVMLALLEWAATRM